MILTKFGVLIIDQNDFLCLSFFYFLLLLSLFFENLLCFCIKTHTPCINFTPVTKLFSDRLLYRSYCMSVALQFLSTSILLSFNFSLKFFNLFIITDLTLTTGVHTLLLLSILIAMFLLLNYGILLFHFEQMFCF